MLELTGQRVFGQSGFNEVNALPAQGMVFLGMKIFCS
jgi:hypothetical protein